jgi:CheY-like chemotaxis protein
LDTKPLALVIEDHEDQNLVFTAALDQAGYRTESILNGNAAQERLNEVVPSMVILDLNLPGISGKDLLSQIRHDERMIDVNIILATADAWQAEELRAQSNIVLVKPISFEQLSKLASRFHPG